MDDCIPPRVEDYHTHDTQKLPLSMLRNGAIHRCVCGQWFVYGHGADWEEIHGWEAEWLMWRYRRQRARLAKRYQQEENQ